MSLLTTLTRMWLTRSTKPFRFLKEYDSRLPFQDCDRLGLYVHIPFCKTICSFCPYCKTLYSGELCSLYLDALRKEIHLVGRQQSGKKRATSLYFGGGTPALAADRLKEITDALQEHFILSDGIGVELHPDNVTPSVLRKLKEAGVTKISIGIQSFQEKFQKMLGRTNRPDASDLRETLSETPFETVSMDFIFALPTQTFPDLKADLDMAFQSGANHVAIYPFIDFSFTPSSIAPMPNRAKKALLEDITRYCAEKGNFRDSIWTFSIGGTAKYSSMTRDVFLGFGCSATSLLADQFKINTFSVKEYCRRVNAGELPTALTCRMTPRQRMIYYLFWTAYGMKINSRDFEEFFGVPLRKMYGMELKIAEWLGYLVREKENYLLTPKGAFSYHYYEHFYTLAYIDKMWGIMRQEAFPEKIEL